jgi:hypothetical protein
MYPIVPSFDSAPIGVVPPEALGCGSGFWTEITCGRCCIEATAWFTWVVNYLGLKPWACGSRATGCGVGDRVQNSDE